MIKTIVFLLMTACIVITLTIMAVLCGIRTVSYLRGKREHIFTKGIKRGLVAIGVLLLMNGGLVLTSQLTAKTPEIRDEQGVIVPNSIAELTKVTLNGREQWISIRSHDQDKPVLLFLAGGPGGSQMAAVRYELAELEKHFVVVNWDQPGAGKSFYAEKNENMSKDIYLQDGLALTNYLKERFDEEKIYLIGESWGSALGIFLVEQQPESYHGFIGTGQMIDFEETERVDYAVAMEMAFENGDLKLVETLKDNGEPPYYGNDVTWKSAPYLNYLNMAMSRNPAIQNPGYQTLRDLGASEYGLLDKVNYIRGIIITFNQVYQQLYDIDLRETYTQLEVPVYFFIGQHDLNAPIEMVETYYERLVAPDKELVWFEKSGHSPWINETNKFTEEVLRCFIK